MLNFSLLLEFSANFVFAFDLEAPGALFSSLVLVLLSAAGDISELAELTGDAAELFKLALVLLFKSLFWL